MNITRCYSKDNTSIFGSYEIFNRVLYGGHENDVKQERFFTFAGNTPIFMGASSDYTKDTWCYQAKNGILMSGLAMTPGHMEGPNDSFSSWFHNSSDIIARWHHGYMSYELTRFSSYFPDVRVKMEVYPLNPHDGYLVHYDITTDQHVYFCAGFGGITPFFGRFEYHTSRRREFSVEDCKDTKAEINGEYATISGPNDVTMWIGTDFNCSTELDSAEALAEKHPSMFLTPHTAEKQIVKITRILKQGEHFTGNILVVRNGSPEIMKKYLSMEDPCRFLRGKIREKYASVIFKTPDSVLDASVPDTIIAQDAAFHGRSFYHGAIGYHAPFLGWRGWYAPALLGWADRVKAAIESHFNTILRSDEKERVWWDGADRPDLDHEGTQYHHLENTSGRLTALLHRDDIYDMQEVAVDMTLYYLEHSGDLETCAKIYDRLCEVLDHEERIFDPDGDGLYQNFLNTWISDGHSYNGAGCAQASSYNYAANIRTAQLGRKLNKDVSKLEQRAERIQTSFAARIWQEKKGVPAESIDMIGNGLIHDDPELSTIYLAADCGNTNLIQTFRMLQWTERNIPSIKTINRGGKLYFSSNWLPKKYSTYGIFPAENACLALTYFQSGQRQKAMEILNGIADFFILSPYPGSITHVASAHGSADGGDIDFTDVSSCYLRLLIEGLWGIRFKLSDDKITLAPQLPDEWNDASISLADVSMTMTRSKLVDSLTVETAAAAEKIIRLPMRYAAVDQVFLNGIETDYKIIAGIGQSFIEIRTWKQGKLALQIYYKAVPYPALAEEKFSAFSGNMEKIMVNGGTIEEILDPQGILEKSILKTNSATVRINAEAGTYDCMITVKSGEIALYLPLTIEVLAEEKEETIPTFTSQQAVDISANFNASLTKIHEQEFRSPRPENYSIGMRLNGRYAWEWNHYGHNALVVDDSILRNCGGRIKSESGIEFLTPAQGNNAVTVSLWDNFPTKAEIPLSGKAAEMAVLLCGTTHAMQSYVVNAKLKVNYTDGTSETVDLIQPVNFDDFLIAAYQQQNETMYFSTGTHGSIQKITLDPAKELKSLEAEAIANEVIVNILGITLLK